MSHPLRSPVFVLGTVLVGGLAVVAVLAPQLAPYDPRASPPPGPGLDPPSAEFPLGTTLVGQDILSRVIWGARSTMLIAVGAPAVAVVIGVVVGVGAGLRGGMADRLAMRTVDVLLAVPRLPMIVLVSALTGASRLGLIALMGFLFWPPIARIVRSQTLTLRHRGFVAAAGGFGGGVLYLTRRHLVPALGPLLASVFVAFAEQAVTLEASVAFLGLGDPTGVSWGLMMNEALATPGIYFTDAWLWGVLPPGFAITFVVVGFAFLGVGLEPIVNPRWGRDRPASAPPAGVRDRRAHGPRRSWSTLASPGDDRRPSPTAVDD